MQVSINIPTITIRIEWDSGHRILKHGGKCANVHGHRYAAELEFEAEELNDLGMVVDMDLIKARIKGWIDDNWDHGFLANQRDKALLDVLHTDEDKVYVFDGEPTAETLVVHLAQKVLRQLLDPDSGLDLRSIRLWETPNCSATWRAS